MATAEVDLELVRKLAESAENRASRCHAKREDAITRAMPGEAASHLNDYFYWIGHANAYKGIVAMAELATVVEDEMDATPQCP